MNRIQNAFTQAREAGRTAFIGYLCAGDPDFDSSITACRTLIESQVDLLELGVPFSDPLADGITNQLAAQRALKSGMTPQAVFELVAVIRQFSEIPIVLYTYCNSVLAQGTELYAKRAKAAGVDGILTLDLPPEEAGEYLESCSKHQLQTVYIVAPTTPEARIQTICRATTGFIYYVSREGVTGEQTNLADRIGERVDLIKKYTDRPVVVGFGVSNRDHVHTIARVADGVVVGSALVNCIAKDPTNPAAISTELHRKMKMLLEGDSLVKER